MSRDRPPSVDGEYRRVELPGSRTLSIRHVDRSDAPGLVALYAGLSDDDTYCRFFSGHAPPVSFVEKMTAVEERGGFGFVVVIDEADGSSRIVGEASCELLPDGDGELGITVAEDARGWLGPYLLDAVAEEAARRGIPNLEADVLVMNPRMLSVLRNRGFVIMDRSEQPAIIRVAIGTASRIPSWPRTDDRPRLLLEASGGRWRAEAEARAAGFQVLACPGPAGGWSRCPALRGEPCPLAAASDLVVDAVPGELGRSLLEAHRRVHPSVPVCVELPAEAGEIDRSVPRLPQGGSKVAIVGILQRLANVSPDASGSPNPPRTE